MTIDERLEALTMNLELMSHELEAQRQRDDARWAKTQDQIERVLTISEKNADQIGALLELARNHEGRIGRLEA